MQIDGSKTSTVDKLPRVSDSEEDHLPHLDFSAGNKDTCVLEVTSPNSSSVSEV